MRIGFTALEIVILLGFLAIVGSAVLFVWDPGQRSKQEEDRLFYRDAEELVKGINSFYISRGAMPWGTPSLSWKEVGSPEVGLDLLVESARVSNDFSTRPSVEDLSHTIYVGKGQGRQAPVWACFVPLSRTQRARVGQLYKIDINKESPFYGSPDSCPVNVTWAEEDVCYTCVAK